MVADPLLIEEDEVLGHNYSLRLVATDNYSRIDVTTVTFEHT